MGSLDGKTAVVLGASGEHNFGNAVARRFADEGARVVVSARREAPLRKLASDIGGIACACDVTEETAIAALFDKARNETGRVDIAVFSAGTYGPGMIAELNAESIRPSLEISFIGAILFFKHAAAVMQGGGSIITVSSLTARLPGPGLAAYAGARAGIDHVVKIAAWEYETSKIRFNSIAAGLIETDMTGDLFNLKPIVDAHLANTPAGRMGTLEDMAEAALFLADQDRSGYINGQILDLSGGQHMGRLPRFEGL